MKKVDLENGGMKGILRGIFILIMATILFLYGSASYHHCALTYLLSWVEWSFLCEP